MADAEDYVSRQPKRLNDLDKVTNKRYDDLTRKINRTKELISKNGLSGKNEKKLESLVSKRNNVDNEVLSKRLKRRTKYSQSGANIDNFEDDASRSIIDRNKNTAEGLGKKKKYTTHDYTKVTPIRNAREFQKNKHGKLVDHYFDKTGNRVDIPVDSSIGRLNGEVAEGNLARSKRLTELKRQKGKLPSDNVSYWNMDDDYVEPKRLFEDPERMKIVEKNAEIRDMKRRSKILNRHYADANAELFKDNRRTGLGDDIDYGTGGGKRSQLLGVLGKAAGMGLVMEIMEAVDRGEYGDLITDHIPVLNQAEKIGVGGKDEELRRLIEDPWRKE